MLSSCTVSHRLPDNGIIGVMWTFWLFVGFNAEQLVNETVERKSKYLYNAVKRKSAVTSSYPVYY